MTRIALLTATGLLLAGCSGNSQPPDPDNGPVVKVGGRDYVQIIVLDGTRCAVITGYRSSGIDCDWTTS